MHLLWLKQASQSVRVSLSEAALQLATVVVLPLLPPPLLLLALSAGNHAG